MGATAILGCEVSSDTNYWQSFVTSAGTVERTQDFAADGQWLARIAESGGWSHYTTHYGTDAQNDSIFFLGTASGFRSRGRALSRCAGRCAPKTPGANHWGENIAPAERGDGLTHGFTMDFQDRASLVAYGPHPEHAPVAALVRATFPRIVVLDIEL